MTTGLERSGWLNVRDFGAKGDGIAIDSEGINRALERASEAGGACVYFPAGTYRCFSIRLKSNLTLRLDAGCVLKAAEVGAEGNYDVSEPNPWGDELGYQDFGHSHWKNSLIWGIGLENVTLEGGGLIDGSALDKWERRDPGRANKVLALKLCRNVCIRDLRIYRAGHFAILPTGVDGLTLDNLKIDSNRDGINVDCCRNVRISNCVVNTPNDDAIVLKSSFALGYSKPTENVTITNCQVMGYDLGSFFDGSYKTTQVTAPDFGGVTGRIKLGTESIGGFRNICITNCTFEHCRGLALETVDGGELEDIVISNLVMRNIVNAPLFLRRGRRMRGPEGRSVGAFRRVRIENIVVSGVDRKYANLVMGVPGYPVEQVSLKGIHMEGEGGACETWRAIQVPELEDTYPDPQFFGRIPACVFFIRHASDLSVKDVSATLAQEDGRASILLDDVEDIALEHLRFVGAKGSPVVTRCRVRGMSIHGLSSSCADGEEIQ